MRTHTLTAIALLAALAAAPAAEAKVIQPSAHCTIAPKKRYSMDVLLKRGVLIPVTCDAPATVRVFMNVSKPLPLMLRMPGNGVTDVTGYARFATAGRHTVRVKFHPKARKHIFRGDRLASGYMTVAVGDPGMSTLRSIPHNGRTVTFTR